MRNFKTSIETDNPELIQGRERGRESIPGQGVGSVDAEL